MAIERALAADLSPGDLAVLLAILHELTTWSRTEDEIPLQRLEEISGVSHRTVRRAMKRLSAEGVIGYKPGGSTRSGKRYRSHVSLPLGTTSWLPSDGATGDAHDDLRRSHTPGSDEAPDQGHSPDTQPETGTRPPIEKESEKTTERMVVELQKRTGCTAESAREALREATERRAQNPVAYAAAIIRRADGEQAESDAKEREKRERSRRGDINRVRQQAYSLKVAGAPLPDALRQVSAHAGDDPELLAVVRSQYLDLDASSDGPDAPSPARA